MHKAVCHVVLVAMMYFVGRGIALADQLALVETGIDAAANPTAESHQKQSNNTASELNTASMMVFSVAQAVITIVILAGMAMTRKFAMPVSSPCHFPEFNHHLNPLMQAKEEEIARHRSS